MLLLAKHHQTTVSKLDIITHIWGTEFKSDSGAVQLINKLRKRIGDREAKMITTIQSRGYRLTCQISWQGPPYARLVSTLSQEIQAYRPTPLSIIFSGLVVLAAFILLALKILHWGPFSAPLKIAAMTPLPQMALNNTPSHTGQYRASYLLNSSPNTLSVSTTTAENSPYEIDNVLGFQWMPHGDKLLYFTLPEPDLFNNQG